jgi:hypothetical protein
MIQKVLTKSLHWFGLCPISSGSVLLNDSLPLALWESSPTTSERVKPVSDKNERMTEAEFQAIVAKIEKEWPVRVALANLAGFKANVKNERALFETEFDLNIRELFLEVTFRKPENTVAALEIIRKLYE